MNENTDATSLDTAGSSGADGSALPAVLSLAGEPDSPVEIGSFELDQSGQLRKRIDQGPIFFSFQFHGIRFEAEVEVGTARQVRLIAPLGKLPYTAEAPGLRRHLRELIRLTECHQGGRLELSRDQDITYTVEAAPPRPFTPISLMATVISMLLRSRPLLDPIGQSLGIPHQKPA